MLTYYVISYLGWPRQIGVLTCDAPGQPSTWMVLPTRPVRSLLLYMLPAPAPAQHRFGDRLTLVTTAATTEEEWRSFCP